MHSAASSPGMGPVSPIPNEHWPTRITWEGHSPEIDPSSDLPWSVVRFGVDSVVFRFKVIDPVALRSLDSPRPFGRPLPIECGLSGIGTFDPENEKMKQVVVKPGLNWVMNLGWAVVTAYPHDYLVNVQCRPSALLARDSTVFDLCPPDQLGVAAAAASDLVSKILGGHNLGCKPLMRRIDLTVDLRNTDEGDSDGRRGIELIETMQRVKLPRWSPKAHPGASGRLNGVDWRTDSNKIAFRMYDKAVEAARKRHDVTVPPAAPGEKATRRKHPLAGPPGQLIRLERQWRPSSNVEALSVSEFAAYDLHHMFLGPFASWARDSSGRVACGHRAAIEHVRALHARPFAPISKQKLVRLIGLISMEYLQVFDDFDGAGATEKKAAAKELQAHGLIFDRNLPPDARLRVGDLVLMAASCFGDQAAEKIPDWFEA